MADHLRDLNELYNSAKLAARVDISSDATGRFIHDLALQALRFLKTNCDAVRLKSLVPGKEYVGFARKDAPRLVSRPANAALFNLNPTLVSAQWQAWWDGKLKHSDLASMSYTIALAPCLAMELFDRQNKKQPATYFEILIGHVFAKSLGTNPYTKATFKIHDRSVRMTMDFLFDMGTNARRIHLPVKMSTRERVVQA